MRGSDENGTTRRRFIVRSGALVLAGAAAPLIEGTSRSAWSASAGTLTVGYGALGTSRHPHSPQIIPDDDINNLIFDPLLTLSARSEVEPLLAARYSRVGDTRWRFSLKRGVAFHDGSPLTAADVKFSMENYLKPEFDPDSLYKGWLDHVEVVDDLTVELVAKKPYRVATVNMGYNSFVIPRSATDPKAFVQRPIGSGPYRFVEHVPNDRVVVEAHPGYWGSARPSFQRIVFRQISENGVRLGALRSGEVDLATNIPVDDVERLRSAGFDVSAVPSNRLIYLTFNQGLDGPWRDRRVRQAIHHAIDRAAIRKAVLGGLGAEAVAPVSRGTRYVHDRLPERRYDVARARQLLAAAGYAKGFEARFVAPSGRYLKDREIAEAIAGQLEAVGIQVALLPLEWGTFRQQRKSAPLVLEAWGNVLGDADFGLYPLSASWDTAQYKNEEFTSLLDQGRTTFDEAKLRAIYARAQEIVWEDTPRVFLFELPHLVAFSRKVTGYVGRADEQIRWHLVRRSA